MGKKGTTLICNSCEHSLKCASLLSLSLAATKVRLSWPQERAEKEREGEQRREGQ